MELTQITLRQFKYGAMTLPDPDSTLTPVQVRDLYAGSRVDLTTAEVRGPTVEGNTAVYEFIRAVGTKGRGKAKSQPIPVAEESKLTMAMAEAHILAWGRAVAPIDPGVQNALQKVCFQKNSEPLVLPSEATPWCW